MNKKDRLLAEKTFAARQVNWERKAPGVAYDYEVNYNNRKEAHAARVAKMKPTLAQSLKNHGQRHDNALRNSDPFANVKDRPRPQSVNSAMRASSPQVQSSDNLMNNSMNMSLAASEGAGVRRPSTAASASPVTDESNTKPRNSKHPLIGLSKRTMTQAGQLRKIQLDTAKELMTNFNAEEAEYQAASKPTAEEAARRQNSKAESYFIPKVSLLRSDGASLSAVYESKKQDTWSLILRNKVKEDSKKEGDNERKNYEKDKRYGTLLRQQVAENREKFDVEGDLNKKYAAIVEETSRKAEEVQQKRRCDAVNRQKQFIAHALEDMANNSKKRQQALRDEIAASSMMLAAAKAKGDLEDLKNAQLKRDTKADYERKYIENQEAIRNKIEKKKRFQEEERRTNREAIRRMEQEEKNRVEEKNGRSAYSKIHDSQEAIVKEVKEREENMYNKLLSAPNVLNSQFDATEAAGQAKLNSDSKYLIKDWENMSSEKARRVQMEQEYNAKLGVDMKKMLQKNLEEEQHEKKKYQAQCKKYQHELDLQLQSLRSRSLNNLTQTMSIHELELNRKLIDKARQENYC